MYRLEEMEMNVSNDRLFLIVKYGLYLLFAKVLILGVIEVDVSLNGE